MILAATGHRPHRLGNEYNMIGPYTDLLNHKFDLVFERFKPKAIVCGMAIGTDMVWALRALKHNIPVIAAIPFIGQESMWPASSVKVYNDILNHELVTKHIVCEGGFASWKMQKRNEWMVDEVDKDEEGKLVAVWDGSRDGGTWNCVKYAIHVLGKDNIIRINPKI
jgi:uncharacterized phage-like protein YoqJ